MASTTLQKFLFLPPVLLGAGVLAWQVVFKTPAKQNPPAERTRHVRVIKVTAQSVVPRAIGFGSVNPGRTWIAAAQVSGKIDHINPAFKKGSILKAGEEIIRIAATDYVLAINQAEANIRSAKARLEEFGVSEGNTRNSLKIEERALAIKEGELDRKKKLLGRGTIAQSSIDQEERDVLTQRKRVLDLRNTLNLLPTQKAAQTEQISIYKSQLETARLNLSRTSIRLPFEARVAETDVEVTQFVGVGQKLGSADGIKTAEIDAQIPQSRFRGLAAALAGKGIKPGITRESLPKLIKISGLHAIVRPRSDNRNIEWRGRVARISDTVDPKTRTIGVIVEVDDSYAQAVPGRKPPLIKGMFVEVELRTNPVDGQIVVPRSAVHDGRLYVVDEKSRLEFRPVETSLVQGDFVVISSGLKPGERIVVSDLSPAIAGMLLKTTPDADLSARIASEAQAGGALR